MPSHRKTKRKKNGHSRSINGNPGAPATMTLATHERQGQGLAGPKHRGETEKSRPIQASKWKPPADCRYDNHRRWCCANPGTRGSHQDRNGKYVPWIFRRMRYLRDLQTKDTIRRHLTQKQAQWDRKEHRRTEAAQLLAQMLAARDGKTPALVVVSSILYRWGVQEENTGSYKSINALEWQQPTKLSKHPESNQQETKRRDDLRRRLPNRSTGNRTENQTSTDKRSRGDTRGSERLTKEAPWLVPPWGNRAPGTSGDEDLTEMAPWMVPPWKRKMDRS